MIFIVLDSNNDKLSTGMLRLKAIGPGGGFAL